MGIGEEVKEMITLIMILLRIIIIIWNRKFIGNGVIIVINGHLNWYHCHLLLHIWQHSKCNNDKQISILVLIGWTQIGLGSMDWVSHSSFWMVNGHLDSLKKRNLLFRDMMPILTHPGILGLSPIYLRRNHIWWHTPLSQLNSLVLHFPWNISFKCKSCNLDQFCYSLVSSSRHMERGRRKTVT